RMPISSMRSVMPYGAIISSVGGWKVPARRSRASARPDSHTITGMPWRPSASAHIRPVGPAPATTTGSLFLSMARSVGPLLRGDVVLADDLAPAVVVALHQGEELLGRRRGDVQADLLQRRLRLGLGEDGAQLRVELGDDRVGHALGRVERVPDVGGL